MAIVIETYSTSIAALGAVTALMLLQLVVADVVGIVNKHVPGSKIPDDHDNLLFRAARTVANTNESIGIFICALLFCFLSNASPDYTAHASWAYFCFRAIYAFCYYANIPTLRSVSFGLSLLSLLGLMLVGLLT